MVAPHAQNIEAASTLPAPWKGRITALPCACRCGNAWLPHIRHLQHVTILADAIARAPAVPSDQHKRGSPDGPAHGHLHLELVVKLYLTTILCKLSRTPLSLSLARAVPLPPAHMISSHTSMASTCWRCLCFVRRTDENCTSSSSNRPSFLTDHTTADVEPVPVLSWWLA